MGGQPPHAGLAALFLTRSKSSHPEKNTSAADPQAIINVFRDRSANAFRDLLISPSTILCMNPSVPKVVRGSGGMAAKYSSTAILALSWFLLIEPNAYAAYQRVWRSGDLS